MNDVKNEYFINLNKIRTIQNRVNEDNKIISNLLDRNYEIESLIEIYERRKLSN